MRIAAATDRRKRSDLGGKMRMISFFFTVVAASPTQGQMGDSVYARENLLESTREIGLGVENQLQIKGNVLAWVTPDSIRFSMAWTTYLSTNCNEPYPTRNPLPSLPMPKPMPSVPPVFRLIGGEISELGDVKACFAVILPGGKLHHYRAAKASLSPAWEIRRDSLDLHPASGEAPSLLVPLAEAWPTTDSALIVAGSGGMLRMVTWSGNRLALGDKRNSAGEDLLSFGQGVFGGAKGGLFLWGGEEPPKPAGRLSGVPVRQVDAMGAMGDEGWVGVREGASWSAFKLTPGAFRGLKVIRDERGLGVERYPGSGNPAYSLLRETPSRFGTVLSDLAPISGVHDRISYLGGTPGAVVKITLSDSEANFTGPEINLVRSQGKSRLLGPFVPTKPPLGCIGPGYCVQPDRPLIEVILSLDSVVVRMHVQTTQYVHQGGTCLITTHRRDSLMHVAAAWRTGDDLEILEGEERIVIGNESPMGIRTRPRTHDSRAISVHDAIGRRKGGPVSSEAQGDVRFRY